MAFGKNRGTDTKQCSTDPESGRTTCKMTREVADGVTTDIAGYDIELDGQCNPIVSNVYEKEEGALKRLRSADASAKLAVARCKASTRPADY